MVTAGDGGKGDGSRVVLVTGSSSGIGLETSRLFARKGWRVYASMRRPERAEALRAEAAAQDWALSTPDLDVRSDQSVGQCVRAILAETGGRIDVVVNNAGYYLHGAVEQVSPDELRAQMETNLIGVQRVTRAVLPAMRARGAGCVVNLGSVSGRVVIPIGGPYHASKFALHALTEAMRYELFPSGIRVVLIEPGMYKSRLHTNEVLAADASRPESPYADLLARYRKKAASMHRAELDGLVAVIYRAATHPRPKLHWPVGPQSLLGTLIRRLTPDRVYEIVARFAFGLWPRR